MEFQHEAVQSMSDLACLGGFFLQGTEVSSTFREEDARFCLPRSCSSSFLK